MEAAAWFLSGTLCYAAGSLFLAGMAWKTWTLARLPRHIRWEMYPLPRDGAAGSKYQHVDWAAQPHAHSRSAEALFMFQEIFLLKKGFAHGRRLWPGSFLLHVGLYLSILAGALLGAEALFNAAPGMLHRTAALVGLVGVSLGMFGTVYLLGLRLADGGLRRISDSATFFHLLLLATMFSAWLAAGLSRSGNLTVLRTHLAALVRGRPATIHSPALLLAVCVTALFLAYLPWSRMFHVAAKYFFYHAVLWDNEPLKSGSRLEHDFTTYLGYTVTWSAEHLRPQGTWAEQAAPPAAGGESHD